MLGVVADQLGAGRGALTLSCGGEEAPDKLALRPVCVPDRKLPTRRPGPQLDVAILLNAQLDASTLACAAVQQVEACWATLLCQLLQNLRVL